MADAPECNPTPQEVQDHIDMLVSSLLQCMWQDRDENVSLFSTV